MMKKDELFAAALKLYREMPGNAVPKDEKLPESAWGWTIFDEPLMGGRRSFRSAF